MKVRLTRNIVGPNDLRALALAQEAAQAVGLPLMVHIGGTHSPVSEIVSRLRKGDVITHSFRGGDSGILDSRDRVIPQVRSAIDRGVLLDVGHGAGSFSFRTAELTFRQEIIPGTISSDVHQFNVNGPVFDLATTLSKFLLIGLSLDDVIRRATINPASAFPFPHHPGTLKEGALADVAILEAREGKWEFTDSHRETRTGTLRLFPVATVKGGRIYGNAVIPVVR